MYFLQSVPSNPYLLSLPWCLGDGNIGVYFYIKFLLRPCAWDGRWPEFEVHGWRLVDALMLGGWEGVTCALIPMLRGSSVDLA